MKNIFKSLISCLALAIGVTSCYDEMDSKSSIDAQHAQSSNVTASINDVSAVSFSKVSANGAVSDVEGVLEVGFILSSSADFTTYTTYPAKEVATSFNATITDLADASTFYVRSYAYTIDGTKVSEAASVTTPVAPVFDLNGTYLAVEYSAKDDSEAGEYEVTVEFVAGSTTDIKITNLWEGGETIDATYDPATGKISIPTMQIIAVHPSYGDVWIEEKDGGETVSGQFTTKGGFLNINTYSAICNAGTFGDQYVKMSHK